MLILGDFNVPKIDWANKSLTQGARRIEVLTLDVVTDCFLHQHVREHTRYRNAESSTLDLIFTKEEEDVKNIKVLPPLGGSDHGMVVGDFVSEWNSKIVHKPRRMYHKGKYDKIIESLLQVDWELEFENKKLNERWIIFKDKLEKLVEKYIPMS